jgi:ADP-ribose pyrophosphatase
VTSIPGRQFPVLIASDDIYSGRVVGLRVDTIEVADGVNVRREVVQHPGAVVLVPVDPDGRILWVRQYRYAVDRELLELPAGTLERDEDPKSCASRELAEETGLEPRRIEELGNFYTAPGFCTEFMHAYAAYDLRPAPGHHADEDEQITVEPLTVNESMTRIESGAVIDAKSLAAFFLFIRKGNPAA